MPPPVACTDFSGCEPAEFLRIAREQLQPYGVEIRQRFVTDALRSGDGFEVALEGGTRLVCRKSAGSGGNATGGQ